MSNAVFAVPEEDTYAEDVFETDGPEIDESGNIITETAYTIACGDLADGFTFRGVFRSSDDAEQYASANYDADWTLMAIRPVE